MYTGDKLRRVVQLALDENGLTPYCERVLGAVGNAVGNLMKGQTHNLSSKTLARLEKLTGPLVTYDLQASKRRASMASSAPGNAESIMTSEQVLSLLHRLVETMEQIRQEMQTLREAVLATPSTGQAKQRATRKSK